MESLKKSMSSRDKRRTQDKLQRAVCISPPATLQGLQPLLTKRRVMYDIKAHFCFSAC
jgi:hypothetical protein